MSKIIIKSTANIDIELDLDDRITIITGNSGTGKTYLCEVIKQLQNNPSVSGKCNIDINKFVIFEDDSKIELLKSLKNKIIILDRYAIYSKKSKEIVHEELSKEYNTWIIFSRKIDFDTKKNYQYTGRSIKELETTKVGTKIKIQTKYY